MATCQVYGNKPDSGPSQIRAQATMDDVNEAHNNWNVTLQSWNEDRTIYASTVATGAQLEGAFTPLFPGFHVVGS